MTDDQHVADPHGIIRTGAGLVIDFDMPACRQAPGKGARFYKTREEQPFIEPLFAALSQCYFFNWSRSAASLANGESGSNFGARSSRGLA